MLWGLLDKLAYNCIHYYAVHGEIYIVCGAHDVKIRARVQDYKVVRILAF